MKDSAFNRVMLNAMACRTPVMTNRVGGVPEYVPEDCNAVMPAGADADDWAERLEAFEENRERLEGWRSATRRWAEGLDWQIVSEEYRAIYRDVYNQAASPDAPAK
ncbi:MAG: glycosyltransferase [Kiritimatiellae bacterium]|nr:glycosyltransferase [Kiritimatiellia bacterium]